MADENTLLGPFVGHVTDSTAKLWLQLGSLCFGESRTFIVTLREQSCDGSVAQSGLLELTYDGLGAGVSQFQSLKPDTVYYYSFQEQGGAPLALQGLEPADLHFRTLPDGGFDEQLDFLLMSCHNPETARDDGLEGFGVWSAIPRIIEENNNVRFALLLGDQVYGDDIEGQALKEPDLRRRQDLYLGIYRRFRSNIHYRKVLCTVPAVLMWDDHDITDGWGSREDSFTDDRSDVFKPEWLKLFEAAQSAFARMQALRNPEPMVGNLAGFDRCFRIGRAGFVIPDLRSNRNVRKGQILLSKQFDSMKTWVEANLQHIDTLFFVTSVVFSHGDPGLDQVAVDNWGWVLTFLAWLARLFKIPNKLYSEFNKSVGDLRDDLNDSWGAKVNQKQADQVLDWLFSLQNPPTGGKPITVIILSGDIHTPGYSTIYSADPGHERAVVPHIVATPVSYKPTSWILEAVYRHLTKAVSLGGKGIYTAQVSHHYCHRNVVVVSLRNPGGNECHLKVKYYLEGFPEPEIMLFDLIRGSHREAIKWPGSAGITTGAPLTV